MRDRRRFWVEAGLGVASLGLMVATLVWPDWLELVLHIDPDGGNGAVEWAIVGVLAIVALGCLLLARTEWRRLQVARETRVSV